MRLLGRILYTIGLILLLHSGYSAFEHLAYIKVVGKHESQLPIDIIGECISSVMLCMIGVVLIAGNLKPISLEDELSRMTLDSIDARPSFRTLFHRGRAMFCTS